LLIGEYQLEHTETSRFFIKYRSVQIEILQINLLNGNTAVLDKHFKLKEDDDIIGKAAKYIVIRGDQQVDVATGRNSKENGRKWH